MMAITVTAAQAKVRSHRTAVAILALLFFSISARPAIDPDFWWHLRSGQWMVSHHAILRSDPFSYTSVGIHQPIEWLAQLGLYGFWVVFGLTGISVAVAVCAAAWSVIVYRASDGPPVVRAPIVGLACLIARSGWTARPQIVTWMFTALTVLAVVTLRRAGPDADRYRNRLWFFVPMFVVWSNCHLCWFYGLAVLWATVAGEYLDRLRHRSILPRRTLCTLAQVSVVSFFAVIISAVGPMAYVLIVRGGKIGKRFGITEFSPPSLHNYSQWPFFLLVAISFVVLLVRWRKASTADVGLIVSTAALGLNTVRAIPLFATVAAPIASRYINDLRLHRASRKTEDTAVDLDGREGISVGALMATVAIVATAAITVVAKQLSGDNIDRITRIRYPVAAVEWIQQHNPPGEMFNDYNWGGYLIWALPSYQVALDGRAEIHLGLMEALRNGRGPSAFYAEGVHMVLTQTGGGLAKAMAADPQWHVSYQDQTATILLRTHPL